MGAIGNFLLRYNAALLALLFLCKNLETPLVVLIKGYFATYLLIRVSRVRVAGGSPFFLSIKRCAHAGAAFFVFSVGATNQRVMGATWEQLQVK